jgi:hypothetical protein
MLGLLPALLLLFELLLDPVFEIGDRVTADAELDEMKRHSKVPTARTLRDRDSPQRAA